MTCSLKVFWGEIKFLRTGPAAQTNVSENNKPYIFIFYLKLCSVEKIFIYAQDHFEEGGN